MFGQWKWEVTVSVQFHNWSRKSDNLYPTITAIISICSRRSKERIIRDSHAKPADTKENMNEEITIELNAVDTFMHVPGTMQ